MRILMLDLGAAWRGGQIQTFLLARELARAGEDVTVAARRGSPLALELERSAADELAVEAVRPGGEGHPGVLLDVARAAARRDPEVLYAGDARGHGAAVWSLAARRRPLVVHRRVAFPPGRDWFSRRKYAAADTLLAISESVARALREAGIPPDRIVVVPDGLAPEAFVEDAAPAAPPYRLVHVGMFDGKKGQEVAIDAVARLAALGWDVHAAFLGDGPGRDALERRASAAGVAERCAFPGIVADVAARLAASHLLLMTSSSEGGSLAVLEAMAAGCPVLAHDVEGAGEFVREAGSGGLVRGLDPESWADAIARTLRDTTATRSWILSGRRYAASRTIAATAALVLEELSKGSGLDS